MFARTVLACARCLTVGLVALALVQPAMADEEKCRSEERSPAAIEAALEKKIEVEFSDTPLAAVVQKFQELLDVPVLLDQKALDEVGIAGDAPVTFEIADITASSALQLILRPLDLVAMPCDELLLITTPDREAENLVTRVYNVSDLLLDEVPQACVQEREPASREESPSQQDKKAESVDVNPQGGFRGMGLFNQMGPMPGFARADADFDSLIEMITMTLEPTSWDEVGGPGSIAPLAIGKTRLLVVSQTPARHQQLTQLLVALRQMQKDPSILSLEIASDAERESKADIRKKLAQTISIDFQEKPLGEVVAWFEEQLGVPVRIDHKALEEVGIATDSPVTLHLHGVSARTALEHILRLLDLTWIAWSEVLLVTTPDRAAENSVIRVYNVDDLCKCSSQSEQPGYDFDSLIELLITVVEPTSWEGSGPGPISPYQGPNLAVLPISQTDEVQGEIEALLTQLRKAVEAKGDR
jgi:hypothetical protein